MPVQFGSDLTADVTKATWFILSHFKVRSSVGRMVEQGGGRIVNTCDPSPPSSSRLILGSDSRPTQSLYSLTENRSSG